MFGNNRGINSILEGLNEAKKGDKEFIRSARNDSDLFHDRLDWALSDAYPNGMVDMVGVVRVKEAFSGDKRGIYELVVSADLDYKEFEKFVYGYGFKKYAHRDNKRPDVIQWYILEDKYEIARLVRDLVKMNRFLKGTYKVESERADGIERIGMDGE